MNGQHCDQKERTSHDTFLEHKAQSLVVSDVRCEEDIPNNAEDELNNQRSIQVKLLRSSERPRRTDDPTPYDTVESETKKTRPYSDETAKDLLAQIKAVDSLSCVKPIIDLTNDAMAWSEKIPSS